MPMCEEVDAVKRLFDLCDLLLQHADVDAHKDVFANETALVEWLKAWSATLKQSQLLAASKALCNSEADSEMIGFLKMSANK
eukprot:1871886-Pyramimonas_sp.AAC.1